MSLLHDSRIYQGALGESFLRRGCARLIRRVRGGSGVLQDRSQAARAIQRALAVPGATASNPTASRVDAGPRDRRAAVRRRQADVAVRRQAREASHRRGDEEARHGGGAVRGLRAPHRAASRRGAVLPRRGRRRPWVQTAAMADAALRAQKPRAPRAQKQRARTPLGLQRREPVRRDSRQARPALGRGRTHAVADGEMAWTPPAPKACPRYPAARPAAWARLGCAAAGCRSGPGPAWTVQDSLVPTACRPAPVRVQGAA
jgi:hypothetical protein